MKLTAQNVQDILLYALPKKVTEEQKKVIVAGGDLPGFVKGEGVMGRFLFDKAKLEEKRADVVSMLKELPLSFRKSEGGGYSFLEACMTADGDQWGEHRSIDELVCLGRALGIVEFCLPQGSLGGLAGRDALFRGGCRVKGKSVKIKRPKTVDAASFRYGIQIAAEVAADYDKLSTHPFLVSECILGKLNVLNGKPKRNKAADQMNEIISDIDKKLDSIEGMMRFMHGVSKFEKKTKKAR